VKTAEELNSSGHSKGEETKSLTFVMGGGFDGRRGNISSKVRSKKPRSGRFERQKIRTFFQTVNWGNQLMGRGVAKMWQEKVVFFLVERLKMARGTKGNCEKHWRKGDDAPQDIKKVWGGTEFKCAGGER